MASLASQLADALESGWESVARPNQLPPPGNWSIWLLLAGRGFGKTRVLSEWTCEQAQLGRVRRIALVGATAADTRDVIVEGESGILADIPRIPGGHWTRIAPSSVLGNGKAHAWPRKAVQTAN